MVEDAIATVKPAMDAKGLRLTSVIALRLPEVPGDSNRLQQVVWNLLVERGEVHAAGRVCQGARQLATTATSRSSSATPGIGMSPDFLPHVFERFRQAESGPTRLHGGLGLGLAIARHIVELHGGTIDGESAGEGQGATFTLRLPLIPVVKELQP